MDFIEPAFQVHFRSNVLVKELVRVRCQQNTFGVGDCAQTVEAVPEDDLVSYSIYVAAHTIKLKNDSQVAIIAI